MEITPEYLASQCLSEDFLKRFWKKVNKTESCWLWTGNIGGEHGNGYGQICRGNYMGQLGSHVASWIIHKGPIPNGLCVLHNCPKGDNRACVNPSHLFLGTKGDNNRDTIKKGRFKTVYGPGEKNRNHILSNKDVIAIRHLLSENKLTGRAIAFRFGISSSLVSAIKHRTHWAHLE